MFIILSTLFVTSMSAILNPYTVGIAVGMFSALWSGQENILCDMNECCDHNWIQPNISQLQESLAENLFGQHLVTSLVSRAVRAHVRKKDPKKALVMSFHGWTGSGKNFVAKFIVESLYKLGMNSKFVHLFISTLHFPNSEKSDIYKLNVQDWIRGNISSCENSLFIFDEMDKMPEGMIDGIEPFIDHHETVGGNNFRRAIFIFLSNTGGRHITRETHTFWMEGKQREDITYKDLEVLVNTGAFNEQGHQSAAMNPSFIDVYVPFLPLERRHVKMCVFKEAKDRNMTLSEAQVNDVVNSLYFWPEETNLYSTSGCKKIKQKLDSYSFP